MAIVHRADLRPSKLELLSACPGRLPDGVPTLSASCLDHETPTPLAWLSDTEAH
jgi:hypothetical protein